jgi:hypothetical protein
MWSCFIHWLHKWQELAGGLIGAIAITSTVWWTLNSERRRRDREAEALRIALGSELRQFAARALQGAQGLILAATPAAVGMVEPQLSDADLQNHTRFVDPVVYPNSSAGLGLLGQHAYAVVLFFAQIETMRDAVRRYRESHSVQTAFGTRWATIGRTQMLAFADALLAAAEAGVEAIPAFPNTPRSEFDREFEQAVVAARQTYIEIGGVVQTSGQR